MTPDMVHVKYRKYDGALHWHLQGHRLGEDEHGVWVGCPAGTVGQRGAEPPITWDWRHVMCFPRSTWWTATFNAPPQRTEIYCDISTVPEWHGAEVRMIDLDLDVIRRRDGTVEVVDEDEFAEHQVRYGYPESVIAQAQASCDRLAKSVGEGAEPFATVYRDWLAKVG
jgi:hypothetical protein